MDRTGLNLNVIVNDGGANQDGTTPGDAPEGGALDSSRGDVQDAPAADLAADVPADRAVDRVGDVASDVRLDRPMDVQVDLIRDVPTDITEVGGIIDVGVDLACGAAHHRCGDTCVSNSSLDSCGPTSCGSCTAPANATATCNGVTCGFSCNASYVPQGSLCVPGCDPLCAPGAIPVPLPGGRFTGTTGGLSANAGSCGGGSAPEAVYQLTLTVPSDVFVTTHGSRFDTVVYMRRGCCGAEIACNDNADSRSTSVLTAIGLAAGVYEIFVDGAGAGAGAYTIDIYANPTSTKPGDTCGRPTRISNTAIAGDTTGYRDDYNPTPATRCIDKTTSGIDEVFYFVLDSSATVTFDTCTDTCIDSILYVRDVCSSDATERVCDDDSCSATGNCQSSAVQSRVSVTLEAGAHYLILDTYPNDPADPQSGPFTVTPTGIGP